MSAYQQWLQAQAEERADAGLERSLSNSDGSALLDLAGNDYLGLAYHPEVIAGAIQAAQTFGAGARASRLVTGTLSLHGELETALATWTGTETGLVFSTGYHANLAVVSALADPDTLIVSDAHVHASLIDACRLSRGQRVVVPHNNVDAVRAALTNRTQTKALMLTESIFSVLGDAAPLAELATLCVDLDALLVVDEAHGLGVAGQRGEGLAASQGLTGDPHVVLTGTLSKSLGAQGGIVLGSEAIRDHLINRARPFIYDTGLAPAATGAALAALAQITPSLVRAVNDHARHLADAAGVAAPAGAVLSVPMPGPHQALDAVARAASLGVRIGCFRPPSTPDGVSRLRLTAHAHHTPDQWAHAAATLRTVVT